MPAFRGSFGIGFPEGCQTPEVAPGISTQKNAPSIEEA